MQIFIPYANLKQIFKTLDYRRLGKQRVECKQVLNIILQRTDRKGWQNHPAVRMWRPFSEYLKLYFNECVKEWVERGYKNNMPFEEVNDAQLKEPTFWGDEELHSIHRANLLRKDKGFYSQFGWTETPKSGYLWIVDGGERLVIDNDVKKTTTRKRTTKAKVTKDGESIVVDKEITVKRKRKIIQQPDEKQITTKESDEVEVKVRKTIRSRRKAKDIATDPVPLVSSQ